MSRARARDTWTSAPGWRGAEQWRCKWSYKNDSARAGTRGSQGTGTDAERRCCANSPVFMRSVATSTTRI